MKTLLLAISLLAASATSLAKTSPIRTVLKCKGQDRFSTSAFRLVESKGQLFGVYGKKLATNKRSNYMRFNCQAQRHAGPAGSTAPRLIYRCVERTNKNHFVNGGIHTVRITAGGFVGLPQATVFSELPMPSGFRQIDHLMCQYAR